MKPEARTEKSGPNRLLEISLYQAINKRKEARSNRLRKTNVALEIDSYQTIYNEKRNSLDLYDNLRRFVPDSEYLSIRESVLLLPSSEKGKCMYHIKDYFSKLNIIVVSKPCPVIYLLVSDFLFFTFLKVQSYSYSHRLVTLISDWSAVFDPCVVWRHKLLSGTVSG